MSIDSSIATASCPALAPRGRRLSADAPETPSIARSRAATRPGPARELTPRRSGGAPGDDKLALGAREAVLDEERAPADLPERDAARKVRHMACSVADKQLAATPAAFAVEPPRPPPHGSAHRSDGRRAPDPALPL